MVLYQNRLGGNYSYVHYFYDLCARPRVNERPSDFVHASFLRNDCVILPWLVFEMLDVLLSQHGECQ